MNTRDFKLFETYIACADWVFLPIIARYTDYPSKIRKFVEFEISMVPWNWPIPKPHGELQQNFRDERFRYRLGRWFLSKNKPIVFQFAEKNLTFLHDLKVREDDRSLDLLERLRSEIVCAHGRIPDDLLAAIAVRLISAEKLA